MLCMPGASRTTHARLRNSRRSLRRGAESFGVSALALLCALPLLLALAAPAAAQPSSPVLPPPAAFLPLLSGGIGQPSSPAVGARLTPGALTFPPDFMVSVKDYGAKGDGITDDTAAIQRALADGRLENGKPIHDDYYGRPKALFFPAGTYLVADTLEWVGCCLTLQGQGSAASIIRLKNAAPGFGDPSTPKPVIRTPDGNMSFRQNIWDLGINTGSNNPGAVGIDWIASNSGAIRNVEIVAGDGRGLRGLDMTRSWPGPCLVKHLRVQGFDYGIHVATPEYAPTFEHITVEGQRVAGIFNDANSIMVRSLHSINGVPAIVTEKSYSSLVLLDAELTGGLPGATAIRSEGQLYARNVRASGYRAALQNGTRVMTGTQLAEYVSGEVQSLFEPNPPARSLNLPVAETPAHHDASLSEWGLFEPRYYGDTGGLQALLDSGKSTIAFPMGPYLAYDERAVTVPAGVRRIVGFSSVINSDSKGRNGGGIKFIVEGNSAEPLIIEQFGYGVKVEQRGKRPVVLKHGNIRAYTAQPGAGDLYLEDVELGSARFVPGQRVWARQFNNESEGPKIVNDGAALWILGLKTERAGTVIETVGGGKTELLGGLIYPSREVPASDVAFISRDSSVSLIYSQNVYCQNCGYTTDVEETRGGSTRRLSAGEVGGRMALYVGYGPAALR
jgi:hypothetical protein